MQSARRALIAGLGLIGGSIGMALRRRGWRVLFYDNDPALDPRDAADERAASLHADVDVAIVATPVDAAMAMLPSIEAPVVTSVCSVMAPLRALGGSAFVAGHPLAGSEERGIGAARADLFDGATWFLDRRDAIVAQVVEACGARVEIVDAEEHDRALALTSHLPQLLSTALAAYLERQNADLRFAGSGLRTFLRLAGSDAAVWTPILEANRANVVPHAEAVAQLAREIAGGVDDDAFARANAFFAKM